ncbi:MAG: YggT family protein [bacterium]
MFVIANLFLAIANLLDIVLTLYMWMVIVRAVLSWINPDPYNPIVQLLIRSTEPALRRIRAFVPSFGGLDLSPMILILGLYLAESFLVSTFRDLALAISS